jgi:putative hydrolase of the HAD superfamily
MPASMPVVLFVRYCLVRIIVPEREQRQPMAVQAVIFDWGGTLTPWHTIDHEALWLDVCARHYPAAQAARLAAAARLAEAELWQLAEQAKQSATLDEVFSRAGVAASAAVLASYYEAWEPHTLTDPDVAPLLAGLRDRGIRVGVLSNTMWPRDAHERIFTRDKILDLIDGAVYSSEIPWVKPHPEAFRAAMTALGVTDPASCVFVGDRPYDDVHGAKSAGMRAVLIPNSSVPGFAGATPDAVITRLSELPAYLDTWQATAKS